MPRCVLTFRAKKGPVPTSDSRDWLAGSLLYIIGRVKYTNHATARPPPLSLSRAWGKPSSRLLVEVICVYVWPGICVAVKPSNVGYRYRSFCVLEPLCWLVAFVCVSVRVCVPEAKTGFSLASPRQSLRNSGNCI